MPICMANLFVVAYLFVKSFPQVTGRENASPLVRIAIVSLGPIVWNAAVLLILFFVSLFLGPMLDSVSPKFGSAIAFIAHVLALVGMVGFFEFLVCQIYFTLNLHSKVAYLHHTFFLSSFFLSAVVPRTLERISCSTWYDRCYIH